MTALMLSGSPLLMPSVYEARALLSDNVIVGVTSMPLLLSRFALACSCYVKQQLCSSIM
jgi:hypothetical protein